MPLSGCGSKTFLKRGEKNGNIQWLTVISIVLPSFIFAMLLTKDGPGIFLIAMLGSGILYASLVAIQRH